MAGANRSLFELVKNLPDTVCPFVCSSGDGEVVKAYKRIGIDVQVIPPKGSLNEYGKAMLKWSVTKRLWVALRELLPYTLRMAKIIKERRIDIAHVNDLRGALLVGLAARLLGCPVVGHLRSEITFGGLASWWFEQVSSSIITVCSSIQSSMSPLGRSKAVTVYNGISDIPLQGDQIDWLAQLRRRGIVVVTCFASVVPFKGHLYLIDAIARLNQRGWHDHVVFVCVGDLVAEYREYHRLLFRRLNELKIDNLFFTGWQSDPFPFYRTTDISVLPSVNRGQIHIEGKTIEVKGGEGFPRTHLEAMWFGIPIVSTDNAGVREQIEDGVNGFVVPPADADALANALERLLSDPILRKQMGEAGQKRVKEFSTEAYIKGVLQVYAALAPRLSGAIDSDS